MSLWLAGYSKTPGFDLQFGSISRHHQNRVQCQLLPPNADIP
jgi:hypothetical protein